MLRPTRLSPDDSRLAALGLPTDREWYSLVARGGFNLPWQIGSTWPRKLDWSGVGTPVEAASEANVTITTDDGETLHLQLWRQRIGDPRENIFLEARWQPEERRNRIALRGLENRPTDAQISSVARARDWFAPLSQEDEAN